MNSNHRPNYKRIFKDIIQLKFPEKEIELKKHLEKETLTTRDVIQLNQLILIAIKSPKIQNTNHY